MSVSSSSVNTYARLSSPLLSASLFSAASLIRSGCNKLTNFKRTLKIRQCRCDNGRSRDPSVNLGAGKWVS